jgi:hypothetical protein
MNKIIEQFKIFSMYLMMTYLSMLFVIVVVSFLINDYSILNSMVDSIKDWSQR